MKLLSILLSLMMFFTMTINTYAKEPETANLKNDITEYVTRARDIFGISMDYDKVDSNFDDNTVSIYWQNKDYYGRNESVMFDKKLNVLSYYKDLEYKKFVRTIVSREDAKKTADELVKKMYPNNDVRFESIENRGTDYLLIYRLYFDNVRAFRATASVSMNRETGEVNNVNTTNEMQLFLRSKVKVDADDVKGEGEAFEAMKKEYPPRLDLLDIKSEKMIPYYTWNDDLILDAKSFEKVYYESHYDFYGNDAAKTEEAKSSQMSDVEIAENEKIQNLKSKEAALAKALEIFSNVKKDYLKNTSLTKQYNSEKYNYNFSFRNEKAKNYYTIITVTADELIPIHYYFSDDNGDEKYDGHDMDEQIAKVTKYLPFFDEYEEVKPKFERQDKNEYNRYKSFIRKFGEYYIPSDTINFVVGSKGLIGFDANRNFDDIEYEQKEISSDEAYGNLNRKFGTRLYVLPIIDQDLNTLKETRLVYAVDAMNYNIKVRATDGKIGYNETKYLFEPSGDNDDDWVKDTVISGFGVTDSKSYEDLITNRDLMYNLAFLEGYNSLEEERLEFLLKDFEKYDVFTKDNLDDNVTLETIAKVLVLNKLNLVPRDIKTNVFQDGMNPYSALLIMLSGDFKNEDFTGDATVYDMLKMISSIIFD